MAILRNKTRDTFTVVNNNVLRDKSLSLKERGLLITLLSLPDNWDFNLNGICTLFPDGKDAIRAGISSLQKKGYIKQYRERDEKGHLAATVWEVYESPCEIVNIGNFDNKEEEKSLNEKSDFPVVDNPMLDIPILDAPTLDESTLVNPIMDSPELGNYMQESINDKEVLNILNTKSINHKKENTKTYWSEMTDDIKDAYVSCFKLNVDYDIRKEQETERDFAIYDYLTGVVCDFICNPPNDKYVHIANADRPYDEVRDAFMRLKASHLDNVRNKLSIIEFANISSCQAYIQTMLYNISSIPEELISPKKQKSSFQEYKKRKYDVEALLNAARAN